MKVEELQLPQHKVEERERKGTLQLTISELQNRDVSMNLGTVFLV